MAAFQRLGLARFHCILQSLGYSSPQSKSPHRVVKLVSPPKALVEMLSLVNSSLPDKSLQRGTTTTKLRPARIWYVKHGNLETHHFQIFWLHFCDCLGNNCGNGLQDIEGGSYVTEDVVSQFCQVTVTPVQPGVKITHTITWSQLTHSHYHIVTTSHHHTLTLTT